MNRKAYTLGLATLILTTASAQRVDQPSVLSRTGQLAPMTNTDDRPVEQRADDRDLIWSENFSNGLAGTNGAWTREGPDGLIWVVNANGPRGAYTQNTERITSSTWSNGFAKFASDSANSIFDGATPTPAETFIDWEGSLISPTIDLSANPLVEIEFQQRSRYCCGDSPFLLEISADGGFSWSKIFVANEGLPMNQGVSGTPTATTETRRFNIASAIESDPSNVRFRFHHNSEAGTSHYYWQVDDIKISDLPENDLKMNYAYTSTTGLGEEYGRIPLSQLPPSMNMGAEVYNFGQGEQTGVVVSCSVTDGDGAEAFSFSENIGTLAMGDSAIVDVDVDLPELAVGLYTATFTVSSDQSELDFRPEDNNRVRTFEVTNNIYGLDNIGNYPTGTQFTQQTGTASFTNNAENVKLLNMYYLNAPFTVHGLEIGLGASAQSDAFIIVSILDTVDVLMSPSVVTNILTESDAYVLTSADVNLRKVTVPFFEPIVLQPGAYFAVASLYRDGTRNVTVLDDITVPQPGLASALWLPSDQTLYSNGTAWAVRLSGDPTLTVGEDMELEGVSMFPNPTTDNLYIRSTQNEKYSVQVMNMLGEQVQTTTFSTSTTMSLGGLAAGVYSVRVSSGTRAAVQRITVQ